MWNIFKFRNKQRTEKISALVTEEKEKLKTIPDIEKYSTELPDMDSQFEGCLRFWVPLIIKDCIEFDIAENSYRYSVSVSDCARTIFLIHCYGEVAVSQMRKKYLFPHPQIKFSISSQASPSLSRSKYLVPCCTIYCCASCCEEKSEQVTRAAIAEVAKLAKTNVTNKIIWDSLGKNLAPIKVACKEKLKNDLETLAELQSMSLSEYLRSLLIKHYLGNGFIPDFNISEQEIQEVTEFIEKEREMEVSK